jgi:hypothetical protein
MADPIPGTPKVDNQQIEESKPCAQTKGQAAIEMAATLFSSDNLVILCLTGIVIYALYQFASAKPDIAEKIITNVASGMIGYLGNQLKNKLISGKMGEN